MKHYCHHCNKQVGYNHKCKIQKASILQLLLYKWKHKILTKDDKKSLIKCLKNDAKARQKKDIWGYLVEYGMIYQLKKERRFV